ncbi:MAG: cytochrome c biogenesis protein CcmF [Anaerolineae bacterium]|nr:MAG: cytochrome c biogenesis protein CcmF [Anaerolineae bacterium]
MIAEVGIITTGLAFVAAVYALIAALAGAQLRRDRWVLSARNAALTTFPLLSVANLALIYAMLNHEFSIAYVWQTSSLDTPRFYLVTGLWGSQAGSLLFWSWLMSAFTFAALLLNWQSERRLMPVVIVVTMATLGFFLVLNNFIENPFERYWELPSGRIEPALFPPTDGAQVFHPADGQGLNPLLRHFGMVFHPPMLYLGFVGFTIPFAFAIAALVTGQLGSGWLRATRRWALVAWLFLSLGLLLGGRWAYDVLGWGGYWGWDPVENAALLPWLTGTAFLHSAVVQEKRGMLKFWNMLLIIMTYLLVVLGTFATRSGVVSSVHSFAESEIGRPMFAFLALAMIASFALLSWRQQRGDLRGADELDSLVSREAFFLLNNWLFLGLTIVVLWGSWAEAITTILVDLGLRKTVINLGPDYYPPVTRWFLVGLFVLMGVAPLAAWRQSTAKRLGRALLVPVILAVAVMAALFVTGTDDLWAVGGYGLVAFAGFATLTEIWKGVRARHGRGENYWKAFTTLVARDRRRYGGYFIHLGMVVLGIGVIGSTAFQEITTQTLNVGERLSLHDYQMQYNGLFEAQAEDGRTMVIARATVYKDGEIVGHIRPRRDIFFTRDPMTGQLTPSTNMSIPGTYSTLAADFYARIETWEGNRVTFRVYYNPLIAFVWLGGVVLILGTLVALWPSRQPERAAQRATVPAGARGIEAGGD